MRHFSILDSERRKDSSGDDCMEPIVLKCTNCGGELEFDGSTEFGFCKYCGTKIYIPRTVPSTQNIIMSSDCKFYLFIYHKGEQTQHAIKDEVTVNVQYRNDAAGGDPKPLGLDISTNGIKIPVKSKLSSSVGTGTIQISGLGSSLTLTKEQKVKININGVPLSINSISLNYGDLVSIDNLILRVQPMSL